MRDKPTTAELPAVLADIEKEAARVLRLHKRAIYRGKRSRSNMNYRRLAVKWDLSPAGHGWLDFELGQAYMNA